MCIDQGTRTKWCCLGVKAILAVAVFGVLATPFVGTKLLAAEPIIRNCATRERLGPRTELPPAFSPGDVRGVVTSPRLATFNTRADPTNFAFRFSGRVNASPDRWRIEVDVLRAADANPKDEGTTQAPNWQRVATIPITGGGPNVFTFSTRIAPFKDLSDAWHAGGLGRLRVVAVVNTDQSQCAFLPVVDRFPGLDPADPTTLIVADRSVDPTKPLGETNRSIRNRTNENTPDYLTSNIEVGSFEDPQQAELATIDYYDTVQTDPEGVGPNQSISDTLPTLRRFINRYFARPFEQCSRDHSDDSMRDEPPRAARYFNNGDLGIGREMHCIKRGCTGELACYVKNFAKLNQIDGAPTFGSIKNARRALLSRHPFATVAMVERQHMAPDAANKVFFVVYGPNGSELLPAAQLDNKGVNKSIPGNCLQCHGINSSYDIDQHEVRNAMFLPFDLEVFKFFSADPNSRLSRGSQESKFRALNRMVLQSALGSSPAARELIEGWYDGDLSDQANHTFREFVPEGWWDRGSPDILQQLHRIQLYTNFIAVGCRGCHITWVEPESLQPGPLTFSTFDHFERLKEGIKSIVCGQTPPARIAHKMPAAEQTLRVLWRSEGRQHFFAQLPGVFGDCRP